MQNAYKLNLFKESNKYSPAFQNIFAEFFE